MHMALRAAPESTCGGRAEIAPRSRRDRAEITPPPQTRAAAAAHPLDDSALREVEVALATCTPSEAGKGEVPEGEMVERGSALRRRRRKRSKQR